MPSSVPSSPLRYPGGKQSLTFFVKALLQQNGLSGCVYAEPYAGGAGLALRLLQEGVVSKVLLNDKCPMVFAFWKSLFEETEALVDLIRRRPVTMEEWQKTREVTSAPHLHSRLEIAYAFFFQNRTNFSGVIQGGVIGGKKQTGKYKIDARYPKERLISLIRSVAEFRDKVEVYSEDAITFVKEQILPYGEEALTYCDPPYYVKGKDLYLNAYRPEDHKVVAAFLKGLYYTNNWLVSYDLTSETCELYSFASPYSFTLPYCANRVRTGSELMAVSANLSLPLKEGKRINLKELS